MPSHNSNTSVDGSRSTARAIAFYLPQFYPTQENDEWWGRGFTEWTNVVKGRPRFRGHLQPHLPADLGFYDLRVPETREAQADIARAHGIEAFCYYHYWTKGYRLLRRPLDEVLALGKPDFPFCLCWANQTWSRAWSGREHDVLMLQTYSTEDSRAHIEWLAQVFSDERYLRIADQPLFLIYLPEDLPNAGPTLEQWREYCQRVIGIAPYFCGVRTGYSRLSA
ncbi:MAG: glycoside hydrolase family 99-like domain-containing protein, partial [Pseudomonadota bacterium]